MTNLTVSTSIDPRPTYASPLALPCALPNRDVLAVALACTSIFFIPEVSLAATKLNARGRSKVSSSSECRHAALSYGLVVRVAIFVGSTMSTHPSLSAVRQHPRICQWKAGGRSKIGWPSRADSL